MRHNKHIEEKLNQLNEGITWKHERQKHVRRRLVREMEHGGKTAGTFFKRKLIPAFSLLLLITIVSMLFLSEFTSQDVAKKGFQPSPSMGDRPSQIVHDQENNDEKEEDETTPDNDHEQTRDHNDEQQQETPEENNDTDTSSETDDSHEAEDESKSDDRILSEQEVLQAIENEMSSGLDVRLPDSLPLGEGQHLTATTKSGTDHYEVTFYAHNQPIPINNKLLFSDDNPATVVARVTVTQFDTQEEADDEVSYEEFDEESGKEVDLSNELSGYQDAGAGSISTGFNMGRWALATKSSTENAEKSETLAKESIEYLQDHVLPIPKQNGYAHLDAENNDNRIIWEKETTVYTIDQVANPMDALDIATDYP